ncbi:MAG: energy transducer TonB [Crocinitomicaceae bacterium]|nr:energy transducer TonB [Crocinitomicaceae bacterium]
MNNLITKLDKYKYGISVMLIFYIISTSIRIQYGFVERPDLSDLLQQNTEEIIELRLEPPEMVEQRINATGEVKNAVNDENSNGKSNFSGGNDDYQQESYYKNAKSLKDVENSVYDLEKSLFNESGGAQSREQIQSDMDKRKKEQEEKNKSNNNSNKASSTAQNSVGDAQKGTVLVSYNLKDRKGQYVPAPGYMCPQGTTGKVIVNVKVDQAGNVIEAKVNSSSSSDDCMTSYALSFAKKSRFNYSSNASSSQEGTITYTYVN